MSLVENLVLQTDDFYQVIRKRTLLQAFEGFAARSTASRSFPSDPAVPSKTILALFADYETVLSRWTRGEDHVLRRADHLLVLTLGVGSVHLLLHSRSLDARDLLDGLLKRLEPHRRGDDEDEDGVWAEFSYRAEHSIECSSQFLRAPAWDRIRPNYPASILAPLDRLFADESPWTRGRLLIWHGSPGTGKTWAIRALMMQWRKRFDFLVVLDPERLTSDPRYYYEVASESTEAPRRRRRRSEPPEPFGLDDPLGDDDDDETPTVRRRRLFIMEDCADLLLKESRSEHFDKIGKLLNMTDGLFGQGREDLFLLTFNEDVDAIDPAFVRPGRCVANIGFPKFTAAEASAWLAAHGAAKARADVDMTLAEMYERALGGARGELGKARGEGGVPGFGERKRR